MPWCRATERDGGEREVFLLLCGQGGGGDGALLGRAGWNPGRAVEARGVKYGKPPRKSAPWAQIRAFGCFLSVR
eukprot:351227-Chlamydomonas_euryale.AAC.1